MIWTVPWTYALTAALMIAVPGPDVLLLSGRALSAGARPALRTLAGTLTGYALVTGVVAGGVGSVVARWGGLLTALRVLAVAYLLWLAAGAWRGARRAPGSGGADALGDAVPSMAHAWRDGLVTAAFNPKGLLFFLALLPPFVVPGRPAAQQLLLLGAVFCLEAAAVYGAVVTVTLSVRRRLRPSSAGTARATAVVLVVAAAVVAAGAVG